MDKDLKKKHAVFILFVLLQTVKQQDGSHMKSLFSIQFDNSESCDSSVGIVLGYKMDDWGSRVRFLAGAGNFSLHHHIQNGSGAHPASYPMGARGSFPGGKANGV
jgi:hypothetical protein